MKKREVKPFINTVTKDAIQKLSFVTSISIKSIGNDLYKNSIRNGLVSELSSYFKRDIVIDGKVYKGSPDVEKFDPYSTEIERISISLNSSDYEYVSNLAFALDCSVSKVVSYCIEKSMGDYDFLNVYIKHFLSKKVDENKVETLMSIIQKFNNGNNDVDYNATSLLFYIIDEFRNVNIGIENILNEVVLNDTVQ